MPGWASLDTLVEYLRPRRTLLVLDDCEHLLAACAELSDALLRRCPSLTMLATSRAPLGVPGETTWRVPSMYLPAELRREPIEVLRQSDAVRLFIDRATQMRPKFVINPGHRTRRRADLPRPRWHPANYGIGRRAGADDGA